ncbi:MAG: hypothetical protein ABFC80_08015, partial [Coriobacteriales bacterium]
MALTLITGGVNTGKTGEVHARVLGAASGCATLLVPSVPEVERAARELSSTRRVGVSVSTFDSYLDGLWGLIGDGRRIVTPVRRIALLRQAIAESDVHSIGAAATRPGFVKVVERVARRAAESGPLDDEWTGRVSSPGIGRDLAAIIESYGHALRRRSLVERSEAHRCVSDRIAREDLPALVAINRFTSFTPPQERFIRTVASIGGEIVVALTYEEGHPATASARPLVQRLAALPGTDR